MDAGRIVAVAWGPDHYDTIPPFSPGSEFPEYPFPNVPRDCGKSRVYGTVRESLRLLGLDAEHFGTADWNPLGRLIGPGQTVVLKPNFVRDFRESDPDDGECLITHGAVIRAAADYVYKALRGRGRIIIADAPQNDANFDRIREIAGLPQIQEFYHRHADFQIEVYDLRPELANKIGGVIVGHRFLPGDPAGYVRVCVDGYSEFMEVKHLCHRLYGAEYDVEELRRHHHDSVQEYLVSKTVLLADCVISLPKLKTHKKTGITVNLKNLVGINGNKNWLPHHREGTLAQGGDQYADGGVRRRLEQAVVACFKRLFPRLGPLRAIIAVPAKQLGKAVFGDTNTDTVRSGNWFGNDTTWRMVLDLNRVLMYADAQGNICDRPVRRFLGLVDGIVAGEGNGPLDPVPRPLGAVIGGFNPVAIDAVCASLMGFDYRLIPMVARGFAAHALPLTSFGTDEIQVISNRSECGGSMVDLQGRCANFRPHFGWKGHIEAQVKHETSMVT